MNKLLAATAAATLAALGSAPASASSSASATISGFTFALFDLNPSDGIAPGITFLSASGPQAYTTVTDTSVPVSNTTVNYGSGTWGPVSSSSSVPGTSSTASLSGSSLSASGTTLGTMGTPGSSNGNFFSRTYAPYPGGNNFSLTPFTLLLVSAPYALSTAVTQVHNGTQGEYSWAFTQLNIYGTGANGSGNQSGYDSQVISSSSFWNGTQYVGQSASASGSLGASFTNYTAGALEGTMFAEVRASGYSYAPVPVPEPGSWAMLLAGIGMLGVIARRRSTSPS